MIDLLTIFHRGGAVLFTRSLAPVPGAPVDALISGVLLEERAGGSSFRHGGKYTVKWALCNELELVFVAAYLNLTNLLYLDELLAAVRDKFVDMFREAIKNVEPPQAFTKFGRVLDQIVAKYEHTPGMTGVGAGLGPGTNNAALAAGEASATKKPAHALGAKKPQQQLVQSSGGNNAREKDEADAAASDSEDKAPATAAADGAAAASDAPGLNMAKLAAMQQQARTGRAPTHNLKKLKGGKGGANAAAAEAEAAGGSVKKGKVARQWDNLEKPSKAAAAALDYTAKIDGKQAVSEGVVSGFDGSASDNKDAAQDAYGNVTQREYSDDEEEDDVVKVEDDDEDDGASAAASAKPAASSGGFFSYFKTLVSGKTLTRADLAPIMQQFKEGLNAKNVAAEISEKLAESVLASLEGKQLASFTSVKSVVRAAVEDALTRILTPNKQVDVLHGVVEANEQKRPYSIVFVGVNGVGKVNCLLLFAPTLLHQRIRICGILVLMFCCMLCLCVYLTVLQSTSLAKTAAYFLSKDLTVGVGACVSLFTPSHPSVQWV
jgi:signal recognition particle receptor subunit alpha